MKKDTEEKIGQLQLFEQSLQNLLAQKQTFQAQTVETESALEELGKSDTCYKIVGNIMVRKKKEDLETDLKSRKEMMDLRLSSIEKQENQIKKKASELQAEVLKEIKDK